MTLQTTLAIIVKKKKRSSSIRVSKRRGAKNEYRKISPEKSRVLEDSTWLECPRITGQSGGRSAGIEHRYTIDDAPLHPRTSRFFRSRALEMKKSFRTSNTRHNDDPRSFRSKQPWFPSMLVLAPRIKKNFDKTDEKNGNGKKKNIRGTRNRRFEEWNGFAWKGTRRVQLWKLFNFLRTPFSFSSPLFWRTKVSWRKVVALLKNSSSSSSLTNHSEGTKLFSLYSRVPTINAATDSNDPEW